MKNFVRLVKWLFNPDAPCPFVTREELDARGYVTAQGYLNYRKWQNEKTWAEIQSFAAELEANKTAEASGPQSDAPAA
jgi:hypothetical protein